MHVGPKYGLKALCRNSRNPFTHESNSQDSHSSSNNHHIRIWKPCFLFNCRWAVFEKNRQLAHFHEELLSYQCVCRPLTWKSCLYGRLNTQKDQNAKCSFLGWAIPFFFYCRNIFNFVCIFLFGLNWTEYCIVFVAETFSLSYVLCNMFSKANKYSISWIFFLGGLKYFEYCMCCATHKLLAVVTMSLLLSTPRLCN